MSEDERYGEGRFVDPDVGLLEGEAAEQAVPPDREKAEGSAAHDVWKGIPSSDGGRAREDPTYYERPVLKEPTWIWAVPAYFYAGGTAGAAAVLGAIAQIADREGLHDLVKRCRWIAAAGTATGTALLIKDLGRPERFLNMLRVFRPSSPMNMGSWVLSVAAPSAAGSALLADADGFFGRFGDTAGLAAGAAGLPLSGYTAVLLSNTAVPLWQAVRRSLPLLFISSAVSSAASLLQLLDLSELEHRIVRRYGIAGQLAELGAAELVNRDAKAVEQVGKPLEEGPSGQLWKASKALTAASLALSLLPGKSKVRRKVAALLGTAGGLAVRFAIHQAGKRSAADPRATFHQQRAGHGGREATGRQATTGPDGRRAARDTSGVS
jgi:formate-dependent nitrite reductase membrane component NrfD